MTNRDIIAAKLHRPELPPRHVARAGLSERLEAQVRAGCSTVLVSAPAGSGKTTCVAEWVTGRDEPVAWLSLDSGDNDPARFLSHLVAALRSADDSIADGVSAGKHPQWKTILKTLVKIQRQPVKR